MLMRTILGIASIAILMFGLAAQAAAADRKTRGDVRPFGAVGDGEADDTVAIQMAVDAVQQGTVYLPPGVYKITAPITLRPGLSLVGEPDPAGVGGSTLLAAIHAPQPVSDVLITRLTFGEAGVLDLSRLTDSVVDMVVAGEIHLGAYTAGVVLNACQLEHGVPGGGSRLEHNVAGQVMPQPNVAPPPAPPPPAPPAAAFSFAPNQLAGSPWYRPGDQDRVINGHLDESFGQRERWPILLGNLKTHHGAFGIPAAEIGHLKDSGGLLTLLRSEGIPVSVELPAWTQPLDAAQLARAEILGAAVDGVNIFSSIFRIDAPHDRPNPYGSGWFVTSDGTPFIPNEIAFDERIPNLLPEFDAALLAETLGSWEQRKQAARKLHPFMASRQPYDRLLESLMQDYVRYLVVARAHWGDRMPAVSLHWNVNPAWEWRDEKGLDAIHAANPAWCETPEDFYRIVFTSPQYNSVCYLEQLLDVLGAAGFKPRTVFMDVDWNYSLPYVTEVLRRHKSSLAARGVQMGINVVEAGLGEREELVYDGHTLTRRVTPTTPPNVLYENTLVAIMAYLRGSGLYEPGMQIRVGSWSRRPAETNAEVDEATPGSLAHAANRIIDPP